MKYGYRALFLAVFILMSSACVNGLIYNKEVFDKAGFTDTPKLIDEFLGIKGRFYCFRLLQCIICRNRDLNIFVVSAFLRLGRKIKN